MVDFRNIVAMAQQQQSIPGLLAMLRGGDPQGVGGGGRGPVQQGAPQSPQSPQSPQDAFQASNDDSVPGWVSGVAGIPQQAQGQLQEDWSDYTKWPGLTTTGADAVPNEEPGAYIRRGHIISPNKFYQDTHRPVETQEGGGIVGGSLLPYRGFNTGDAWSTKGQTGYFGQTDPWGTMWGAGGPGG